MSLGKGLESLIPRKPLFDSNKPNNQPQSNLEDDLSQPSRSEVDVPRTGHPAGSSQLGLPTEVGSDEPREKKILPLEQNYSGPDRGISADDQKEKNIVFQIETDKIKPNPHQPRRDFDTQGLQELTRSIMEFGVIQPLIVTKREKESERGWDVEYELVAGERRLLAAKAAGLATVPAIVRQVPAEHEKLELAVTENIQRSDLNPIEFARAIAKLQEDFKLTQREIAARLGKSREAVANSVRLLSLSSEMQEAVAEGKISESQARLLLGVDDVGAREKLFRDTLDNNLTVREVSAKVRQLKGKPEPAASEGGEPRPDEMGREAKAVDPELLAIKEQLETALGAPIELKSQGEGGKLTINFYSKEELEGILARFRQTDSQSL